MPGFLGVVEDTENGEQRYERLANRTFRLYSVARSPLKEPEDHLTGESVVFSMERLLRLCGEVIYGRRAVVFGYGKVGRSAARALASRGVRVSVVDTNPVRAIEASSHGFRVLEKKVGLATADLILGATGNFSLREDDFRYVRNGCFVASVTSSDDELDITCLPERYTLEN
jgi:adenosylhomocysteinase